MRSRILSRQAVLGPQHVQKIWDARVLQDLDTDADIGDKILYIVLNKWSLLDLLVEQILGFWSLQSRHLEVRNFEARLLDHVDDFANMYVGIWLN